MLLMNGVKNMDPKYGAFVLAFVLILQIAVADLSVQKLSATYELSGDGIAHEKLTYTIMNQGGGRLDNMSIPLPPQSFNVSIVSGNGAILQGSESPDERVVRFPGGVAEGAVTSFSVTFMVVGLVDVFDNTRHFSARLALPGQLDALDIWVLLPAGHTLPVGTSNDDPMQFIMLPAGVLMSDGNHLIIAWSRTNIADDHFDMFVRFQEPPPIPSPDALMRRLPFSNGSMMRPRATSPQSFLFLGAFAFVIIMLFVTWLQMKRMVEKAKDATSQEGPSYPMADLRWDEREVVDALLKVDGQMNQNALAHNVDFSKAKLSKLLAQMEARGLIVKEKTGKINRIRLEQVARK